MISASWNNVIVVFIWLGRKLTAAFLQTEFKSCICLREKVQGCCFFLVVFRKTGIKYKGEKQSAEMYQSVWNHRRGQLTSKTHLVEAREWKNASAAWRVFSGPGCQDASWRCTSVVLKPNCHDDPAALIQAEGTEAHRIIRRPEWKRDLTSCS